MPTVNQITPCLWFDSEAEQAARFYVGIFKNAKLGRISYYPKVGQEQHGKPAGSVLTVEFELDGTPFLALNGGPVFKFNEAVSLMVSCETQDEVDYFWEQLGAGGDPSAQACGWLRDRYGLSWQVVPTLALKLFTDPNRTKAERAFQAMMKMKKMDIKTLQEAFDGP